MYFVQSKHESRLVIRPFNSLPEKYWGATNPIGGFKRNAARQDAACPQVGQTVNGKTVSPSGEAVFTMAFKQACSIEQAQKQNPLFGDFSTSSNGFLELRISFQ